MSNPLISSHSRNDPISNSENDVAVATPSRRRRKLCIAICLVVFLPLTVYLGYAGFQLSKLLNTTVKLHRAAVESFCTNDIRYNVLADIKSESRIGIGVRQIDLLIRSPDVVDDIASMTVQPLFKRGKDTSATEVIGFGTNRINLNATVSVESVQSAAVVLSSAASLEPTVVLVDYRVVVSLAPIIFLPIAFPISGTAEALLNDPGNIESDGNEMKVEVNSVNVTMNEDGGLISMFHWSLDTLMQEVELSIPLPELSVNITSNVSVVSKVTSLPSNITSDIAKFQSIIEVPYSPSPVHLNDLQELVTTLYHGDIVSIQVGGACGGSSSCMLQQVLDAMPKIPFRVENPIHSSQFTSSGTSSSTSSSFEFVESIELSIDEVSRSQFDDVLIVLGISSSLKLPFHISATMSSIYLMISAGDIQEVASIELESFNFHSNEKLDLSVAVHLVNDKFYTDTLLRSIQTGNIQVGSLILNGRSDRNFWSAILGRLDLVLDISNIVAANKVTTSSLLETDKGSDVGIEFYIEDSCDNTLQAGATLSVSNLSPIGVDITISAFSVDWMNSGSSIFSIISDLVWIPGNATELHHSISVTVSRQQTQQLGSTISAAAAGDQISITLLSSSSSEESYNEPVFDLDFGQFSVQDAVALFNKIGAGNNFGQFNLPHIELIDVNLHNDVASANVRTWIDVSGFQASFALSISLSSFMVEVGSIEDASKLASVYVHPVLIGSNSRLQEIECEFSIFGGSLDSWISLESISVSGQTPDEERNSVLQLLLSRVELQISVDRENQLMSVAPIDIDTTSSNSSSFSLSISTVVKGYNLALPVEIALQPSRIGFIEASSDEILEVGSLVLQPILLQNGTDSVVNLQLLLSTKNDDERRKVAQRIGDFLNGERNIVVEIFPEDGASRLSSVPFNARLNLTELTSTDQSLSSNQTHPLSSIFSVNMTEVNLLGSDVPGQNIEIPCLFRGILCPDDRQVAHASGFRVELVFEIATESMPIPIHFATSPVSALVEYGVWSPMVAVEVFDIDVSLPSTASTSSVRAAIEVAIRPMVMEVMGAVFDAFMDPRVPLLSFGVHGEEPGPGVSFLSSLMSEVDVRFKVPVPTETDADLVNQIEFDYHLNSTGESKATFKSSVRTELTLPLALEMGDINIELFYEEVPFISIDTSLNVEKNTSISLDLDVNLVGHEEVRFDCFEISPANPKMCALSKFLRDASGSYAGGVSTNVTLRLSFINVRGENQAANLNLLLFDDDPLIRKDGEYPLLASLIAGFEVKILGTMGGLVTGAFSGTVAVPLELQLRNPANFDVQVSRVAVKVNMRDRDGLDTRYLPGINLPPKEMLLSDLSLDVANTLPAAAIGTVNIDVPISMSALLEIGGRALDEMIFKQRMCLDLLDAKVDVNFQAEGNDPFTFTQNFVWMGKIVKQDSDCMMVPSCIPEITNLEDFAIFNFADPNQAQLISLNGQAKISGNNLVITEKFLEKSSVFFKRQARVDESFSFTFSFSMKTIALHSDGVAFVIQGTGPTAIGSNKYALGYKGPSLAVIFHNSNMNRVYLKLGSETKLSVFSPDVDFDDGGRHEAMITYSKKFQRIDVFLDEAHVFADWLDMTSLNFPDQMGWFGITGSTSFMKTTKQSVHSMSLSRPRPEIANFYLYERGRVLPQDGFFTIFARDSCKFPLTFGKNPEMTIELRHKWRKGVLIDLSEAVTHRNDATSRVRFSISIPGGYAVYVRPKSPKMVSKTSMFYLGDINIEP